MDVKPDVVGLSFATSLKEFAINYIKIVRDVLPKTKIIAGGSHPTINPEEVARDMDVDFTVYGEGEQTFPELLYVLKENKDYKEIKGMAYNEDNNVIVNPSRPMLESLDMLPWPARDLLPMGEYLKNAPLMPLPYPGTNLLVSKGCPGNCLFCQPTLRKLTGNKVRYRSVNDVVSEIKFLIKEYKIKSLDLGVDEPTFSSEWMMEFSNALIKENIKIKWGLASRVDTVNQEMLKRMAKAGCVYISYGIESGSQKIMNMLRKGTKVEQAEQAIKWAEQAGICGRANIMIGSPGETNETLQETVNFIKRARPDFIFVAATTPLYGTDLYNLAEKEGMLVETKGGITGYDFGHLKLKDLSNEDLQKGLKDIVNTYKLNLISFIFNPVMLFRKKHIYIKIINYFLSLLKNRKELVRMLRFYMNYGKQVKVKE
jgi:radical SAM superfamily enzyme YgiQ (UPF0313 family)